MRYFLIIFYILTKKYTEINIIKTNKLIKFEIHKI